MEHDKLCPSRIGFKCECALIKNVREVSVRRLFNWCRSTPTETINDSGLHIDVLTYDCVLVHDELCDEAWKHKFTKKEPCGVCVAIAKAREEMFAKCIAAVEAIHSPIPYGDDLTYCRGCADSAYDEYSFTWPCPVVNSVRALQEKP